MSPVAGSHCRVYNDSALCRRILHNSSPVRIRHAESGNSGRPSRLSASGLVVIGYLQIVRVVDNGTSNGFTDIAVLVTLILLGLWTAFLSPFSRANRWRIVLAAAVLLVAALSVVRIDGFDGNLKAHLAWRWTPKPDVALATKPLDGAVHEIDVRPTSA